MSFLPMTTGWVDGFLVQLLAFALRATVVLAGAWAATALLRRASAATRHMIWTSAIAGVLALPLITFVVPAWNVPVFTISARVASPLPAVVPVAAPVASVPSSVRAPAAPLPAPAGEAVAGPVIIERIRAVSLRSVLIALWGTLALLLLARLAVATTRLSSWQRSSRPVEDAAWLSLVRRLARRYGIDRPVVLLENALTDVPVTWGIVYPVILLPASATQWDEEQRVAVLTHELAHVKRFDALSQLLGQLALALLWFHPLAWLAVRRMRLEREHACDDFVLVAGARASRYADDLLGFARRLSRPTAPAAAALAMARRSELEGRLLAILDPAMKRTHVRRARVALLTLTVLALATPLAAFRPAARVTVRQPAAVAVVESPAPSLPVDPALGATTRSSAGTPRAATVAEGNPVALPTNLPTNLPAVGSTHRTPPQPTTLKQLSLQLSSIPELVGRQLPTRAARQADTIDVQALIDITRATRNMKSDYDKSQLLLQIAKRYQPDDSLREAYLDVVFSMSSDYERGNALIALLSRDSLPVASTARVLASAKLMSSDNSRAMVLKRISPAAFADTAVQKAFLDVIVAMSSNTERASAMSSLVKQRPLAPVVQLGLLRGIALLSSNTEKANVMLQFLEHQGIADPVVRRAFIKAAETLSSDYEYRRVMATVLR